MPIEKGQDWGWAGSLPEGAIVVASDRGAAAAVTAAQPGDLPVVLGITSGDLARTLGIRDSFEPSTAGFLAPVDAVRVKLDDGTTHIAVAHIVVGRPLVDAEVVAVMNAAFIGNRNVAPRNHPGDGKVEVVRFQLPVGDRWQALQRMPTGSHLPHPNISLRRQATGSIELAKARPVRIDGHRVGRSRTIEFEVLGDAMLVAIS